jgi:hypothetical protein
MSNKVKCTCGWSWNKSDSSKKDMYVCHQCGKDNTMKNGGWLNKFDVPEAQNGIEGTMGGLTDQGFNYNGAWGGTMAMGGNLPGSVGFTYARTQGSAPANGKYTKKTKASAQNGEEMKFYQEGLDWKPKSISRDGSWLSKFEDGGKKSKKLLQPEIEYMKNYLESPMYLERLAKMAGTEKQLQDDTFGKFNAEQFSQSNLDEPLLNVAGKQVKNTKDALNYIKDNISIGDYDLGRDVAGVYDSGVKDIRLRKDLFAQNPTVGIHELSHATLAGREPYTKDLQEKYLNPIFLKPGSVGWEPIVQTPTEVKARLDSVRYLAKKKGLYNAGKEKFTEKHLQLLEKDPEIQKDFNFKQLKDQLKPGTKKTGFIWMMNNIAKLQDEESNSLPLAKNGEVITDPNGQWAHPGEITRIPSNQITMQGVDYPVLGISDTGDTQMMYPGEDYEFDGKSVTEYPMMQNGGKKSLRSLMNNDDLKAKSDATKVVPQKTMTKEQAAKLKAKKDAEELQRRKSAIAKSAEAKSKPFSVQNLADESGAIGDKLRIFPNDPDSFIDEYLNPGVMIGNMASGIGRIPLNIQEGNYGQAAMSVATPLAVGALAGIGAQSTGQFANNLVNPFAGTGEFLTAQTPLKNAYNLLPEGTFQGYSKLKNPNSSYRVAGLDAAEDFKNTGVLRSRNTEPGQLVEGTNFVLPARPTAFPSFQKGYADLNYLPENGGVVFKTDLPTFKRGDINPVTGKEIKGRHYAHRVIDPETGNTLTELPASNVTMYESQPNWLRGYKEIPKPTSSIDDVSRDFKSEIDWGNWNKEIPSNTQLMNEYNAIEQTTKANNTWMKNSDGSAFSGTPEQFVQQNSENFKKAFGNTKLKDEKGNPLVLHHGHFTDKDFSSFLPSKRSGISNSGYEGDYSFFTPNKSLAEDYAGIGMVDDIPGYKSRVKSVYINSENPLLDTRTEFADMSIPKSLREGRDAIVASLDPKQFSEVAVPYGNNVKSAIGNNGMFDMTNPNIYKSVLPIGLGLGAASQIEQKKNGGWLSKYN